MYQSVVHDDNVIKAHLRVQSNKKKKAHTYFLSFGMRRCLRSWGILVCAFMVQGYSSVLTGLRLVPCPVPDFHGQDFGKENVHLNNGVFTGVPL